MTDPSSKSDTPPNASSVFAYLRTRLAMERTLMAWVRTCTALIGFGFTIVQFFQRLETMPGVEAARRPQAPRFLGLALIGAGVIGLLISMVQYNHLVNYLRTKYASIAPDPTEVGGKTPLLSVALALVLIGVFAFVAILFRMA